jgi:hypothetical protein
MSANRSIVAVLLALLAVLVCAGQASANLHPQAGRFLQRDPLESVDGTNLYSYLRASPLLQRDPTGWVIYANQRLLQQGVHPWPPDPVLGDPVGSNYSVSTNKGTPVTAWKPTDGSGQYWCHGYTFDGSVAPNGPLSVYGGDVEKVLEDEYERGMSCLEGDIVVFGENVHSGKITFLVAHGGVIDEDRTMVTSKWGRSRLNRQSLRANVRAYGQYRVYVKLGTARLGCCAAKGENEQ